MSRFFEKLHLILTIKCDQVSRLQSDSFERRLLPHEVWAVRLHVVGCWSCRQFRRHLETLSEAFRRIPCRGAEGESEAPADRLSEEAKQRMRRVLGG